MEGLLDFFDTGERQNLIAAAENEKVLVQENNRLRETEYASFAALGLNFCVGFTFVG